MDERNKCPVCVLRPVMYLSKFYTFTVCMICPHSQQSSCAHFRRSKIATEFALANAIFLLLESVIAWNQFSKTECTSDGVTPLVAVVLTLTTGVLIIHMQVCLSEQLQHGNGLLHIFASRQFYELHELVDLKFARKLYWLLFWFYTPCIGLCLALIGQNLYNCQDLTLEKISDLLSHVVISLIYLSIFVMVLMLLEIYFLCFEKCHQKIEKLLTEERMNIFLEKSLRRRLRLMQKFHMAVFANFQIIRKAWDFSLMLFWISGAMICVGNFYSFISYILQSKVASGDEIILLILSGWASICTISVVIRVQNLYDVNNDILSFLFKCPISKFNPLEAAQVELLISTFILQKPLLKAADMFAIGTNFLASVGGTVLTYGLVALQFHALWSTK